MNVTLHQAVFGYERGHRLLSASIDLPTSAARVLREVSDSRFTERNNRHLCVVPLPDTHYVAMVSIWPAPDAPRPGSVWSHVLLVETSDLSRLKDLVVLLDLFVKPNRDTLSSFREPIVLTPPGHGSPRFPSSFDDGFMRKLLLAVYGKNPSRYVEARGVRELGPILFSVWSQQWPTLRGRFSFRTRPEVGGTSRVGLEIVERLQRERQESSVSVSGDEKWLDHVIADLQSPNRGFRQFLWRFGAESKRGASDMQPLATLHYLLEVPASPGRVVSRATLFFPHADQMRELKRSLLGPASPNDLWAVPEDKRLLLALKARMAALDHSDLQIPIRLAALATERPRAAASLAEAVADSGDAHSSVVAAFTTAATSELVTNLLDRVPSMAQELIVERPSLLQDPDMWNAAKRRTSDLVDLVWTHELLDDGVVEALILSKSAKAATQLSRLDEGFALDLVRVAGRLVDDKTRTWKQVTSILKAVNAEWDSLSGGVKDLSGTALLVALSLLDPRLAAQQLSAGRLMELSREPKALSLRLATIRVLKALENKSHKNTKYLWQEAFPVLHRAIADAELEADLWKALDAVLPDQGSWDRCHRLREALAKHIKQSEWSIDDVEFLVASAGKESDRLYDLLGTKKKPWYMQLTERFLP